MERDTPDRTDAFTGTWASYGREGARRVAKGAAEQHAGHAQQRGDCQETQRWSINSKTLLCTGGRGCALCSRPGMHWYCGGLEGGGKSGKRTEGRAGREGDHSIDVHGLICQNEARTAFLRDPPRWAGHPADPTTPAATAHDTHRRASGLGGAARQKQQRDGRVGAGGGSARRRACPPAPATVAVRHPPAGGRPGHRGRRSRPHAPWTTGRRWQAAAVSTTRPPRRRGHRPFAPETRPRRPAAEAAVVPTRSQPGSRLGHAPRHTPWPLAGRPPQPGRRHGPPTQPDTRPAPPAADGPLVASGRAPRRPHRRHTPAGR